ncbi:LysR family transcriptional regulator [Acrocarpospora pleiomorpha]|uniref:LysR family transcriptional regulator n=1 Tax=Acrocarpospora pleiomorpha TaxID=90975 RepID=A0A5M3XLW7_9ACTN|nr:LysR substrate-binding domain-containing protein [Acrocarpospora pleiomorpha]GES21119.1 LysR family transcriptional regulator [Acrocarpospora pleiomorpha]
MYRLHHLVTLQAVHRTGSFATAARELGYTSSAVSQQIAALEKDTGLVLFDREARGVRMTAAAHRLVELSRRVLASVDELEHQVRQLATGASGRIRLGSFPTGNVGLVPRVLPDFAADRPGIEVTLEEGEPDTLVGALVEGALDVAFLYEYGFCPRQWPEDVTTEPLFREDLLLLRRAGSGPPAELSRLADQSWITSAEGTAGATSLTRLCAAAGFVPRIRFRSNNYDVVRELVVGMGGVAVAPALGHRADNRIDATRLHHERANRTVLAAYRSSNSDPILADFLRATRRAVPERVPYLTSMV